MKAASISELQKELALIERKQLLELCMRMAKYKKENKEFLSYLLFQGDEKTYINSVKEKVDEEFANMNRKTNYLIKKSLRKILRIINKYVKYSGLKQTEVELKIYFCSKIRTSRISIDSTTVLSNLYYKEIERIKAALSHLHEDLQYDYQQELDKLR